MPFLAIYTWNSCSSMALKENLSIGNEKEQCIKVILSVFQKRKASIYSNNGED